MAELAGQATIEQTICVHVLALAVVMAGSGDLEGIRGVRYGNRNLLYFTNILPFSKPCLSHGNG